MHSKLIKQVLRLAPVLCVMILAWLSHQDGNETVAQSYVILDKLVKLDIHIEYLVFRDMMHFVAFFAVGFTIYVAVNHIAPPRLMSILITLISVPIIAFVDEYHQSFVPGRTPSLHDFVLDVVGGGVGLVVGILGCYVVSYFVYSFRYKNKPVC